VTEVQRAVTALAEAAAAPASRAHNPYWTYLAGLNSAESKRKVQGWLDELASILLPASLVPDTCAGEAVPWGALRYEHTAMLRAVLVARLDAGVWSAATVNAHLSALRGVVTEAWRLGFMSADERDRAKDVRNVSASRLPAGRDLGDDEIAAMLDPGEDPGPLQVRDTAIIAWLWSTGGRRAEAAAQLIEKYDRKNRAVKIVGKGNRERTGYLHPEAAVHVGRWLAILGKRSGPMFRHIDRWGNIGSGPLTPRSIGKIVDRRRRAARLEPLSAHDYRRTFVGDLLDSGADVFVVQKLAGHQSPATTAIYDRRAELQRRDAIDRRSMPGGGSNRT